MVRERAGDQEGSEALLLQAADYGDNPILRRLAEMRDTVRLAKPGRRPQRGSYLRYLLNMRGCSARCRRTARTRTVLRHPTASRLP